MEWTTLSSSAARIVCRSFDDSRRYRDRAGAHAGSAAALEGGTRHFGASREAARANKQTDLQVSLDRISRSHEPRRDLALPPHPAPILSEVAGDEECRNGVATLALPLQSSLTTQRCRDAKLQRRLAFGQKP